MVPQISVVFFFLLRLLFVFSLPRDDISLTGETWMGEALWENEKQGHGWDTRVDLLPPSREFIKMKRVAASDPIQGLGLQFRAFGKTWTLDLSLNTFLLTSATKYDVRNEKGDVISSDGFPFPHNCFYIGSVRAGDGESGLAAISTCKGIRGMLTTNVNDYAIQPKGLHGLETETKGHSIRVQEVPLKFKRANMTISAPRHSPGHPLDREFEPHHRHHTAVPPAAGFAKGSSNPPRKLISELALIVDKEFQQKYIEDFPDQPDKDSLTLFLTETVNWMQMWYVHSTFGYQIWFHLTQVVFQSEEIDYTKYPGFNDHDMLDQVCNWQADSHEDSGSWDHLIFMSNKNSVFGNRADGSEYEGLAILGGECDRKKHCVGVKPDNFQWSAWHRTVAHESGHEFGAEDDYWGESAEICMNGLMRRGVFKDHEWAHCSLENFETWFPKFKCLLDSPTVPKDAAIPSVPVNIAFRAEAQQSSTYISSAIWGAWKATDGPIVSPTWDEGANLASCTQTMQEDNPWLRIKIEDQFLDKPFDWIRIINRWDKHGDRLSNLEVRVGDEDDISKNQICFQSEDVVDGNEGGGIVFSCGQSMKGKYVSVQLLGKDKILTVCEIQVFQRDADLAGIMPQRHVMLPEGETCVNVDADCEQKAAEGKCGDDKVARRCRKSCNLCVTECWDKAEDCAERKNQNDLCYDAKNTDTLSVCKKSCNLCGCADMDPNCAKWAEEGDCITNPLYMQIGCRKSCKTCDGKPLKPPAGCVDHHKYCEHWAKWDECDKNPFFMHHHCTKSCNMCEHVPCMDYEDYCDKASGGNCRFHKIVKQVCRKSCGYCKKDGRENLLDMVCYDLSYLCGTKGHLQDKCYSGEGWGDWMFENCKKLCGYCTPGVPGKIIKDHPHYKDGLPTKLPGPGVTVTKAPLPPDSTDSTVVPGCHDSDIHPRCEQDAKDGRCKVWKDFMSKYCAKSCGFCGSEGICADDISLQGECPKMKNAVGCSVEWMQDRCAKTCDAC